MPLEHHCFPNVSCATGYLFSEDYALLWQPILFYLFVQLGNLKLFCKWKQIEFHVCNLYKTRKWRNNWLSNFGLINWRNYEAVLCSFSCNICTCFKSQRISTFTKCSFWQITQFLRIFVYVLLLHDKFLVQYVWDYEKWIIHDLVLTIKNIKFTCQFLTMSIEKYTFWK